MTLREAISRVKKELKEVGADYTALTNKFAYSKLISKGSLLIQRESDTLRLGSLQDLYQIIPCIELEEVPAIDKNCYVSSDLTIYRTCKLPDLYSDFNGVVLKSVRTADRFGAQVTMESLNYIINAREDSNSKWDKSIYGFYEDGRIYMEKKIPIRIEGMFVNSVKKLTGCGCSEQKEEGCIRFLDSKWFVPRKLEDAIISAVVMELANGFKRFPEQQVIDKNPNT